MDTEGDKSGTKKTTTTTTTCCSASTDWIPPKLITFAKPSRMIPITMMESGNCSIQNNSEQPVRSSSRKGFESGEMICICIQHKGRQDPRRLNASSLATNDSSAVAKTTGESMPADNNNNNADSQYNSSMEEKDDEEGDNEEDETGQLMIDDQYDSHKETMNTVDGHIETNSDKLMTSSVPVVIGIGMKQTNVMEDMNFLNEDDFDVEYEDDDDDMEVGDDVTDENFFDSFQRRHETYPLASRDDDEVMTTRGHGCGPNLSVTITDALEETDTELLSPDDDPALSRFNFINLTIPTNSVINHNNVSGQAAQEISSNVTNNNDTKIMAESNPIVTLGGRSHNDSPWNYIVKITNCVNKAEGEDDYSTSSRVRSVPRMMMQTMGRQNARVCRVSPYKRNSSSNSSSSSEISSKNNNFSLTTKIFLDFDPQNGSKTCSSNDVDQVCQNQLTPNDSFSSRVQLKNNNNLVNKPNLVVSISDKGDRHVMSLDAGSGAGAAPMNKHGVGQQYFRDALNIFVDSRREMSSSTREKVS